MDRSVQRLCVVALLATAPVGAGAHLSQPSFATVVDSTQRIDVNQISMVVTNTGSLAFDRLHGAAGLEFPKGSGHTAVFAAGLWLGALVNGAVRTSISEYYDDYQPGSVKPDGTPDDPAKPEYKGYKLFRSYRDAHGGVDVATRDAALADYSTGAVPHGAPAVTVLADGSLGIVGDEMMWSVYNDLDADRGVDPKSSKKPLGVEVSQTTYAYHRAGALDNAIFVRYRIANRGQETLENVYAALWSDPDLGEPFDDLVGCDSALAVVYCYNATNADEVYGALAPCIGYDVLQGPLVVAPRGDRRLGATALSRVLKSAAPQDSIQTYNRMRGLQNDGGPTIDPTTGQPTTFEFTGDPMTRNGWLDTLPADRRLMISTGPFTMAPGDTQEIVVAIVIGQGGSRLASIGAMRYFDSRVKSSFARGDAVVTPPPAPRLVASPAEGSVILSWDARAESVDPNSYPFQGYNLYQARSPDGPFTRIATFDRDDGVASVTDRVFDPESGLLLDQVTAWGVDSGLRYSLALTRDTLRSRPLVNGLRYAFAIEGYGVDLTRSPRVLVSPRTIVDVVPQPPGGGIHLGSVQVSPVVRSQVVSGTSGTTDVLTAVVVDSLAVRDAGYQVGFKPAGGANTSWYVVRDVGTAADTVVNDWHNTSGGEEYPVVDGLQLRLVRLRPGALSDVRYRSLGTPALVGVDRGMPFFGGGAGYAIELFGSAIRNDTNLHACELRFTGGAPGQYAYRYRRMLDGGGTPRFLIQDYVPVPFTVWDTDAGVQLNAAFLENAGPPAATNLDGRWDPDTSADGGREIVWILDRPYFGDAIPDSGYFKDPSLQDVLRGGLDARYLVWPRASSPGIAPASGDLLQFVLGTPATPNDRFMFTTRAASRSDVVSARDALGRVLAVPNPYFFSSAYEHPGLARTVKFTHLPVRCTIRLFDLSGALVRTIEKNDDTSQASWDLANGSGRLVASGVYIFHVDAPGVGTRIGKLAVFQR